MPEHQSAQFIERKIAPPLPLVMGVFTLSIFLSAILLFSVQPMFTKMTLPLLGGASNVWNTAMVFFQGTLLGGYLYAHLISKHFQLKTQIGIHAFILALGFFFLPLAIASGWTPPDGGAQAFWLIALFAVSIGVPFFAISANASLLQRWFSYTTHKDAGDPYFLYAASNFGSLLSLGLYPVYFEPLMRLQDQTGLWAWGYRSLFLIILLAGISAFMVMKPQEVGQRGDDAKGLRLERLTIERRLWWVFLAFIPSSLMLGVTSHMTNNIGSVPFLWIVPLALYLLTFIIVFAKTPLLKIQFMRHIFTASIILALIVSVFFRLNMMISISVGILISPLIFNQVYEYLLVLALAGLAHPRFDFSKAGMLKPIMIAVIGGMIAVIIYNLLGMVFQDRSFFSVVKVEGLDHELGRTFRFAHGDTIHNYQLRETELQTIPLAYYTRGGTFDKALQAKRGQNVGGLANPLNVAMVGLGAGAMACYEQEGDDWTYFEIDPVIVEMARDPEIFSYMERCSARTSLSGYYHDRCLFFGFNSCAFAYARGNEVI